MKERSGRKYLRSSVGGKRQPGTGSFLNTETSLPRVRVAQGVRSPEDAMLVSLLEAIAHQPIPYGGSHG